MFKRYVVAAMVALFLVSCGASGEPQPRETVTIIEREVSSVPPARSDSMMSPEQQIAGLEMVWAQQDGRSRDTMCQGFTQFGYPEAYEAFSEGAGGYVVDYDIFVEFFQRKCNGYGV